MPFRNSWPGYHPSHPYPSRYYHPISQSQSPSYSPPEPTYQELHSLSYQHQDLEPPLPEPWLNSKDDDVLRNASPEVIISSDPKTDGCVGCGSSSVIRVHYGANSCHGCKAFFRRTVFDARVYKCSGEKKCEVKNGKDSESLWSLMGWISEARNRCRACRFQNCLKGGMNPKLVREERSEASSSKVQQQDSETSTSSSPAPSKPQAQESQLTLFVVALEKETELLQDKGSMDFSSDFGSWSRDVCLQSGLQNPNMVIKRLPVGFWNQNSWNHVFFSSSTPVNVSWMLLTSTFPGTDPLCFALTGPSESLNSEHFHSMIKRLYSSRTSWPSDGSPWLTSAFRRSWRTLASLWVMDLSFRMMRWSRRSCRSDGLWLMVLFVRNW